MLGSFAKTTNAIVIYLPYGGRPKSAIVEYYVAVAVGRQRHLIMHTISQRVISSWEVFFVLAASNFSRVVQLQKSKGREKAISAFPHAGTG